MSLWRSSGCSGMKSVSVALPSGVSNRVSSTIVSSTYPLDRRRRPEERIDQKPPGSPRMHTKNAGESKLGRHAQSIEPPRLTSALPWQLPSSA